MAKKQLIVTVASVLIAVGAVVWAAFFVSEGGYYVSATVIIIAASTPFFTYFEDRKMKTGEVVTLAMMTSLSVASRLAFAFAPQVKPMAAFVAVTGIAFGANAGFITGALAVFASNFFLGQGIFTPFQMLGMGLVGLLCGLIFHGKKLAFNRVAVAITGGTLTMVVYGIIVDGCAALTMASSFAPKEVFAIYLSGLPFNVIHGLTTALVLALINRPMNFKFERLRIKYGIFDKEENESK